MGFSVIASLLVAIIITVSPTYVMGQIDPSCTDLCMFCSLPSTSRIQCATDIINRDMCFVCLPGFNSLCLTFACIEPLICGDEDICVFANSTVTTTADPCDCPDDAMCPELHCYYGEILLECTCCPVCKLAPGDNCGDDIEIPCGSGLICELHETYDGCVPSEICVRGPYEECGRCNHYNCPSTQYCSFGIGMDYCGCCEICLNGPGGSCGGPNNYYGQCGDGFYCVPYENSSDGYGQCVC